MENTMKNNNECNFFDENIQKTTTMYNNVNAPFNVAQRLFVSFASVVELRSFTLKTELYVHEKRQQ